MLLNKRILEEIKFKGNLTSPVFYVYVSSYLLILGYNNSVKENIEMKLINANSGWI